MEICYKKELGSLYMVIPVKKETESYEEKMLLGHRVEELLQAHYNTIDGEGSYFYDISGLTALEKYLAARQLQGREFSSILKQLVELPFRLESYLMSDRCILLEKQTIFLDEESGKLYFCLLPGREGSYMDGMKELSLYFLKKIDHQDEACVSLAYELLDRVTAEGCDERSLRNITAGGPEPGEKSDEKSDKRPGEGQAGNPGEKYDEEIRVKVEPVEEEAEAYDDIWDENPALKDKKANADKKEKPGPPKKKGGETVLKVAGICAPILAVIVVGIILFL